jgi:signal transduction histidine kinase
MQRRSPVSELRRKAPEFAHSVRDDVMFFRDALENVAGDDAVPSDARHKLKELSARLGGVAQKARQFLQVTDTESRVAINARDSILGMESLLRRILGDHKLRMDLADDLWPIQADSEMQFAEILIYLVTNACKAIRDIGTVGVRARNVAEESASEYVSIEVTDSGVGIPQDTLGHIFEPFVSVNGKPGSISLAHIEFVVRKLGGRIGVQSEVGQGTTFKVLLPHLDKKINRPIR